MKLSRCGQIAYKKRSGNFLKSSCE
jgi:hypothetical protein